MKSPVFVDCYIGTLIPSDCSPTGLCHVVCSSHSYIGMGLSSRAVLFKRVFDAHTLPLGWKGAWHICWWVFLFQLVVFVGASIYSKCVSVWRAVYYTWEATVRSCRHYWTEVRIWWLPQEFLQSAHLSTAGILELTNISANVDSELDDDSEEASVVSNIDLNQEHEHTLTRAPWYNVMHYIYKKYNILYWRNTATGL